jgi:hypothetical protein
MGLLQRTITEKLREHIKEKVEEDFRAISRSMLVYVCEGTNFLMLFDYCTQRYSNDRCFRFSGSNCKEYLSKKGEIFLELY